MPAASDRRRATIEDVASQAHVSAMTVSRVINKTGAVAPATAERVYAAIAKLDYIPHKGARMLVGRHTETIGLVFPEFSETFFFEMIRGVEATAVDNGYAFLLYRPRPDEMLDMPLGEHNSDGLIVVTDGLPEVLLRRLHARRFPVVLLHRSPPKGLSIPSVTFENKRGAYEMAAHLIGCGHRRIAFLAGPPGNEDSYWREVGYRAAMAAHDIPVDPTLIGLGQFDDKTSETLLTAWLDHGVQMDAIFAGDDVSARGAMRAVHNAGLRIPDDIAVVGFDDIVLSQYLNPPLTTVRAPIEEAGRIAAQQLICRIQGRETELLTLLPTELVIRGSCGGARGDPTTSARRSSHREW